MGKMMQIATLFDAFHSAMNMKLWRGWIGSG